MRLRSLLGGLVVSSLFSCAAGLLPPLAPDELEPKEGALPRQLFGSGKKDIWRYWVEVPANAGQQTPKVPHLRHFDGASTVTVPVPTLFDEASCGAPATLASVKPGVLWLASFYVPQCGFAPFGTPGYDRVVLGTVSRDGTWVDRSSDFPRVTAPSAYLSVELTAGAGVLLLKMRVRDATSERFRFYRVTDTGTTELVVDSGSPATAIILDAMHVYLSDGTALNLTHQLQGDRFVTLPMPVPFPGGNITRGGPEVWLWNANDVLHQEQNRMAYRFDGTAFQRVDFTVEDPQAPGYTWQAVGAVPRGNGKLTLFGNHVGVGIYAYSEHDYTARQLADGALKGESRVYGVMQCDGSNQSGQDCLRAQSAYDKTLDDGTIVLRSPSSPIGTWAALVPPDVIPGG